MKLALGLILISTSVFAEEAKGWKIIAKTLKCQQEVSIEAKVGEKFVYAVHNGKRRKLLEQKNQIFQKFNPKTLTYLSDTVKENYHLGDATFTFVLPGSVMSSSPSLTVYLSGVSYKCEMGYKD